MNNKKAITIIELMIVLVISGLMIIVVGVGAQLIKAAKVRNIVLKITNYEHSILSFHMTYDYFPGDFPNTNIWLDEEIKNTCAYVNWNNSLLKFNKPIIGEHNTLNQQKIAGNGDQHITYYRDGYFHYTYEAELVMCHLILSGFIPKKYYHFASVLIDNEIDKNTPKIFSIDDENAFFYPGLHVDGGDGLVLMHNGIILKKIRGTPALQTRVAESINLKTLMAVDCKMDDCKPGDGLVLLGSEASNNFCSKYNDNNKAFCDKSATIVNFKKQGFLFYAPNWMSQLFAPDR